MKANAVAKGHKAPLSKRLKRDWHKNKWKYIMILPVLIYLFLFCYKPMYGLVIAFKDYKITRGIEGSNWSNPWYKWFLNFFTDPYFGRLLKNTFLISGLTILFGFPAPIILALMINEVKNSAFKRTVQTITYMPYFISMVVLCGLLKTFCMQDGLFAQIAVLFGGKAQNYLANPAYFRTIYVLSDIWSGIGWNSIIYLAALSSIDQQQYEAARVDGANRFEQMIHITLPGLVPTIMVLFILRMGNILNVGYEKILLLYNSAQMQVYSNKGREFGMQTKVKKQKMKSSLGDKIFVIINTVILLCMCFVTLYPIWYVLCASMTSNTYLVSHPGIMLWPHEVTFGAYKMAFSHPLLLSGYKNTLIVLAVSLPINILLTLFAGYFMASKDVMFKPLIQGLIMFTMFFSGGMIPAYLNVRSLGLYNSLWALILPGALSVYNSIICKTAIESVPESLKESAYIDGANDVIILFKIIVPLIKATLAVLLLYYGVAHWNAWFNASIYLKDNEKLPIQNIMRAILIANSNVLNSAAAENDQVNQFAEAIKYSTIILTTVPVLCIYPFIQKYFVKGVMIGAVKG